MKKTTDMIRAVSAFVEGLIGNPPVTHDVQEGFDRPCSFLEITDHIVEQLGGLRRDDYEIEIYYFSETTLTGYADLIAKEELFSAALLDPIAVTDHFMLFPEAVSTDIDRQDMCLTVSFTIKNAQVIERDETGFPVMETLGLN